MRWSKNRSKKLEVFEHWEAVAFIVNDEANEGTQSDFGSINENSENKSQHKETDMTQNKYEKWIMPLFAEFFGQLMFAFVHSMSAGNGFATASAITDGIFVTIMVITIGHISGAHVNSAVTVGVALSGGMSLILFVPYIVVQLLGSMAGAGLAYVSFGSAQGAFGLGAGVTVGQGVLCEAMLTILLVFAVLMGAVDQGSILAAFGIGFTIMIDIFAGNKITGACMNPSLSFGPAVVSGKWQNYWVYWVGPILGSLIAVALYRLLLGNREKRLFFNDGEGPLDGAAMKRREEAASSNTGFQGDPEQSRM
uniref:aquaporin-8-like isoform X1 n=2 Tax=Styela clava TaxID=7725 RepID=UPI00193AA184|nr:aquaporin-8-like isoform X1 [Styela clava]